MNTIAHIPRRNLIRAEIECSRIGFGGSRLHYISSTRAQQTILETAFSYGINYFDVAPLYGHGLAERALGSFLKRHSSEREKLVVATKWGLPGATWTDWFPENGLHYCATIEALRRKVLGHPSRPLLTTDFLLQSVEASLQRLCTPYIDILWMHEPKPELIPCPDAILTTLRALRKAGKIRFIGIAGYPEHVGPTLQAIGIGASPDMPVLRQCDEQSWNSEDIPDVTFGAISKAEQRRSASRIDRKIAADRLRLAIARRKNGVVLFSTTNPDNIRHIAKQVETF